MRKRNGFTLIELLVVISIIVLLMAILLPTLQQVKKQAKAVKCQANLHKWGLAFSMYTGDYDGRFFPWTPFSFADYFPRSYCYWPCTMRTYCGDTNDVLLCPAATTPNDEVWAAGDKSSAWAQTIPVSPNGATLYGSYGLNAWIGDAQDVSALYIREMWKTPFVKGAAHVPVLTGGRWAGTWPLGPAEPPPEHEGARSSGFFGSMDYVCINRHNGGINGLLMDWSVRKLGLKELWTLKWHREWNTAGLWTKAGGVQPEDWPEWMRGFKDY
ncbi:MAG: type II secretion system protein [Sedimentisphaerales bacterium]|jgi:prepilin-type N-terminal cleavage/methylation domain-containing protein